MKYPVKKPLRPRFLVGCGLVMVLFWPAAMATAEIYSYDPAGRLVQVVYDDGNVIRYDYDDNSNILSAQVVSDALFSDGFEQ